MTEPTRRDRTRPVELLGISAVLAVVIGVIGYFSVKDLVLAAVFAGVAFIVTLVVFAMLLLAISPRRGGDDDQQPPAH